MYERPLTKVSGIRPHPRDGHTAINVGHSFLVFGGDRHKRSFNDFYLLDLQHIMKLGDEDEYDEEEEEIRSDPTSSIIPTASRGQHSSATINKTPKSLGLRTRGQSRLLSSKLL